MGNEKKNNGILLTLFLIALIDSVGFGISIPVLTPLLVKGGHGILIGDSYRFRTEILGWLLAAYPLAQFIGAPLIGALSDRIGRKKALLLCIAGSVAGYIISGIGAVGLLPLIFAGRIIDGLTGGNVSLLYSCVADITDQKNRARVFGILGVAGGVGFIFGPFVGGKLSDPRLVHWFNNSTPFYAAAIFCVVNMVLTAFVMKEPLHEKHSSSKKHGFNHIFKDIKAIFQRDTLAYMFTVFFLYFSAFGFFTQSFQVFMLKRFSFSKQDIGNIYAYIGFWLIISQGVFLKPVHKRYKPINILKILIILQAALLPILIFIYHLPLIYAILPVIVIVHGIIKPTVKSEISGMASKADQGTVMGVNASVYALSHIIPPIMAGYLEAVAIDMPITIASIICLISWSILILAVYRVFSASQSVA